MLSLPKRGAYVTPILVTVLLGLLLTACGGDTPTATPSQPLVGTATATSAPPVAPTATTGESTPTAVAPVTATAGAGAGSTFTNPVLHSNFPDPFVLEENGVYYAYATNGAGKNIQEARSTDMVHWELLNDAMPALPGWAKLGGSLVWAPEVIKIGDKYLMYYVARDKASNKQCVGVAVGDKPDAKFLDTNKQPFVCQADLGGTIDPDVFRDGDKLYLYYKNDGNCCGITTRLWGQALSSDGLSLTGQPSELEKNDALWEGKVVEAPTMWKHDSKYYLFYSGNNYAGFEYAVGYASCDTPLGPCKDAPENPILHSRMDKKPLVVGPGHQALIQIGDQTWILYHVWDTLPSGMTGSNRYMYIDKLNWENGKPLVEGPTTDPEPAPQIK